MTRSKINGTIWTDFQPGSSLGIPTEDGTIPVKHVAKKSKHITFIQSSLESPCFGVSLPHAKHSVDTACRVTDIIIITLLIVGDVSPTLWIVITSKRQWTIGTTVWR